MMYLTQFHYLTTWINLRRDQRVAVAVGATVGTRTDTEMEQESWQIAYTTGGATIGLATADVSNSDYVDGKDERQTVLSLGISF